LVPDQSVSSWVDRQDGSEVFVTAISKAEVKFGLQSMPQGKRRWDLQATYQRFSSTLLMGRVLPFDDHCTELFARFAASAEKPGLGMSTADQQKKCNYYTKNSKPLI
jgi:toxin FitB